MRNWIGLDVKDTIIVFDEAHNIEEQAEDNFSIDLSQEDMNFTL